MAPERVVLCGGASARGLGPVANPVELDIYGRTPNVHFRLEEVRRALWTEIPPLLRDLLDLSAYVYAADQAVSRANGGRVDGPEVGGGWRRAFRFRVPVREVAVWNSDPVRDALESVLSFLSEDEYAFEFVPIRSDKALAEFIDFDTTPFTDRVGDVQMCSGGLDSLGGAVAEAVTNQRSVLLLNHRSNEKMTRRYADLMDRLGRRAGDSAPLRVAVRVNKRKAIAREYTQRTRSFLFAALGVTFARMIGLDRLRFYENGVVSLNLPLSAQVVGARASRTTHPRVLAGFGRLFGALLGRPFRVENPFLWHTKTDVVKGIADAGCGELIGLSMSCAHTWERTTAQTHCGVCSQCVDRRFAVLAAGQGANDPAAQYAVDLITGERRKGDHRTLLVSYLDLVTRVEGMHAPVFLAEFGEVARVLGHTGLPADAAAAAVFDLYRRHARQVTGVIEAAIAGHAREIRRHELPRSSLLRIACDDGAGEAVAADVRPHPAAPAPGNSFVRRGRCWAIRFGGGAENTYTADRGFEYLRVLLERPDVGHAATGLRAAVCLRECVGAGRSAAGGEGLAPESASAGEDVLDPDGESACEARLVEIQDDRERLEAGSALDRLEKIEELDAERQKITAFLRAARGKGGTKRTIADMTERVRKSVGNAVRRALKQVRAYDPALFEHLKSPTLTLGRTLTYSPRGGVTWHFND